MTSGFTLIFFFCDIGGGFEDGARLHLGDLGIGDAEAAAAVAEHRVELVQLVARAAAIFSTLMPIFLREIGCCALRSCGRNSCSGGSSKRIVAGKPLSALKMPVKSSR